MRKSLFQLLVLSLLPGDGSNSGTPLFQFTGLAIWQRSKGGQRRGHRLRPGEHKQGDTWVPAQWDRKKGNLCSAFEVTGTWSQFSESKVEAVGSWLKTVLSGVSRGHHGQ